MFRLSLALLVTTSFAAPALAQQAEASVDGVELAELADPIVVIGTRDTYRTQSISSATKTDTDLQDVPQAVSVIPAEQIADQAMRSITDVLRYVPGVALSGGEGHRDQVVLRGNSSTADFFVDGFRDDVQYYRGLYNLDRVEVLKGPNAMIFGRGGGGGIINRVTKRPEHRSFVRGAASLDNEGAWYGEADLNTPLAETVDARVNAVYEEFDTFRDAYKGHRIGFNPTLAWHVGPDTRIDIGFEYARDRRVIDRGIPSDGPGTIDSPARPLKGFDETFFGQRGVNRTRFDGKVANTRLEHRFSERLKLVSKAQYGDYDKFYRNALAATAAQSNGTVGIEAYQSRSERHNALVQNDLIADLATGPVQHILLVGTDLAFQHTTSDRLQGFFDSGVPTTSSGRRYFAVLDDDFIDIPPITFRDPADHLGHTDARSRASAVGVYVQDQAKIGEHVEIVAGLRRDWFDLDVTNRVTGQDFSRKDALWSPRLGLVLKPTKTLSVYASWSRSFLPQSGDQFSSLDVTTEALKPERFTNHEVGVKWRALPNLDLTLAAYILDRTNTRETDPATNLILLSGEQRSKGIELTAQGKLTDRLSLSGGMAFQDVEIRKSSTASLVGRKTPLVPEFQASLWGRYDFTSRFGAGLGVYHQSKSFASISNAVVLPAFTRVDAAGYARLTDGVELQFNVENLLDRDYVGLAFNDNNLTPANPRTLRATVRFGF